MIEYEWMKGRSRSVPAAVVAKIVQAIADKEETCPPERLREEALNPASPIHGLFTWDIDLAAVKWQIHEARRIINSIEIVINEVERAPAFISIRVNEVTGYRSAITIMTSEVMYDAAMAEVRKVLAGWRRRYSHLGKLWDEIDAVLKAVVSSQD